jgi:hypothetical protein
LGTRTGRPSDAPIPLCLCKTPASTIPRSGSIAGGEWLPTIRRFWRWIGSMRLGGSGGRRLTKRSNASMVGSNGEAPVHCHHSFTVAFSLCYLTTADASNLLLLFPLSFAEAITTTADVLRFTPRGCGSVIQGPCYASTNRRGRRMSYPAVCSKWVTLFGN